MNKRRLLLANNPLLSGPALQDRENYGIPYREILLSNIDRDPNQPRQIFDEAKIEELAESIKSYGVLSPILVKPSETSSGRFVLVAGERRFRASIKAGKQSIPAVISQSKDKSSDSTLAIQLVENLQRSDLTPLERAQAIGVLKESYSLSVREIAAKLGISKSMVQRSLEILDLPDDLIEALKNGASESKILVLAKIEDKEIRASYLKDLDTLTRSSLADNVEKEKSNAKSETKMSAEDARIAEEIQRELGMKAKISRPTIGAESGKLSIEFYSDSDLQEVFRRLMSQQA